MKNKKLVLDFDSVLCGFTEAWCDWINENYHSKDCVKISNKDILNYSWPSQTYGHEANDFFKADPLLAYREWIKPIPLSHEFVTWCKLTYPEVSILTHANEDKTTEAKFDFIRKHYGNIKLDFFDTIEDKYKHLDDCILVDDYPLHLILNASRNGNQSILFDYEGSYGWSKLVNYWDLIWKEKPNLKHIHIAKSYIDVVEILKGL